MKKIGLLDAELLNHSRHRFPNLCLMKLSSYYKKEGLNTELILDYKDIKKFNQIFVSKIFTKTQIPLDLYANKNVIMGGTGFNNFSTSLPDLFYNIEHSVPDYTLYDIWIDNNKDNLDKNSLKYYTDFSIGFSTRGCFRKCEFCVNKNYNKVQRHAEIKEFLDINKKYICLLDDNILGYCKYNEIFQELEETKKRFQFKQGMDIRLLTHQKANLLLKCNYLGDYIFAFDNIKDQNLIENKIKLWREYSKKNTKFYVLVAYKSQDLNDIEDMFKRIKILLKYKCFPYIMRYESYKGSKFEKLYTHVTRWCNQPALIKKMSFKEFCLAHEGNHIANRIYKQFSSEYPEFEKEYFNLKW